MTAITGFMCILMGLLAELLIRTYYEAQGKPIYLVASTRNLEKPTDYVRHRRIRGPRLDRGLEAHDRCADSSRAR